MNARVVITSALPCISLAAFSLFLVIIHRHPTHIPPSALISCNCHVPTFIVKSSNSLIKVECQMDCIGNSMKRLSRRVLVQCVHYLGITLVVAKPSRLFSGLQACHSHRHPYLFISDLYLHLAFYFPNSLANHFLRQTSPLCSVHQARPTRPTTGGTRLITLNWNRNTSAQSSP